MPKCHFNKVAFVLKMCSKFTGEHPCRSVISIKLQSKFIEISLRQGCSPVNLLHTLTTLIFAEINFCKINFRGFRGIFA